MQRMSIKLKNIRALLLILLATLSLNMSAQNITITGNVKDKSGEPVIGASVTEKGTTNGIMTDINGYYTLKVSGKRVLTVSYIGMKPQEISVKGRTKIDIVLEEDAVTLSDIVVIGYGTTRKKDLTGSVASITGDQIAKIPVTNVAQAMTGRLAGVQITTADGSPDAEISIRVRGGGSVTGDNSPLYIVDGFPVSSINDVAPTDIQSIDVLKDASSTAIYGSRGANGVVIITTKSAQAGKTQVSYNGYIQGKYMANKLDVLDPYEFVTYNYEYYSLRNRLTNFTERYGVFGDLDLYKYQKGTDWQDELFGNADLSQSHNLSITGGNDKTRFSLSGTYTKDGSLMPSNNFERYNLNFKLNHQLAKNLTFDFNSRLSDTETNGAGTAGSTYKLRSYEAIVKAPVNGMWDNTVVDTSNMTDDEYNTYINDMMTLSEKSAQYWRRRNDRRFSLTGGLNWDIVKNLTYRVEGGYEYDFEDLKNYWGPYSSNSKNEGENKPMADWNKENGWQFRVANTLTYKWKAGTKHSFDAMIGQELVNSGSEANYMKGKYFDTSMSVDRIFSNMGLNSGSTGSSIISSTQSAETKMASFFGRFNYRFADRYLFTLTMRADGSSKFAKGNRWGYFPAAAFAWRINDEKFMENAKDLLSNLKLRLSYGEAGNNRIGNTLYKQSYKSYSGSKYYGVGDTQNPYYTANSLLPNPDLKWETTITRNVGLDFGLWDERLTGTVDLYYNSTKDLLIQSPIVAPGYTLKQENVGETSNKGIEFTVNGNILRGKDYSLSVNANISFNKNRVEALSKGLTEQSYNSGVFGTDIQSTYEYLVRVGEPLGLIYGYVTDGYYTTDDFSAYDAGTDSYTLNKDVPTNGLVQWVRPGSLKLKDLDGDGKITASGDRTIIGKTQPKFTGGFGLNATYKGFDFSAIFNFVYGNKIYNADKMVTSQTYTSTTNFSNLRSFMNSGNRYTYINGAGEIVKDLATLKAMNETGDNVKKYWSPISLGDRTPILHSWVIEDGSFLRLQNMTLGYTIPSTFTKKFACSQLRLYCTLNNVFCITNYNGYDPEVNSPARSSSSSSVMPGIDFSAYPKSFSWTAGVNITF